MADAAAYSHKIEIDQNRGTIKVGDFVYSISLLAGGFVTAPGHVCRLSSSDPYPDGSRHLVVQLLKPEMREVLPSA